MSVALQPTNVRNAAGTGGPLRNLQCLVDMASSCVVVLDDSRQLFAFRVHLYRQ
jgi:hypothetical protein